MSRFFYFTLWESKMKGQKHMHRSETEWRTILERFDVSGQSQMAFCSEAGIAPTTFQLSRRRFRVADHGVPSQNGRGR